MTYAGGGKQRFGVRVIVTWAMGLGILFLRIEAPRSLGADDAAGGHAGHRSAAPQAARPLLPFPQNRVRDYYAEQARHFLGQPRPWPEQLPEFPGLDGGSFGHWGQNPEADNFDVTLNSVDLGGLLAQVTRHFGTTTFKAVDFRFGPHSELAAVFDPVSLRYADCWRHGFVRWHPTRFGITSGVDASGQRLVDFRDAGWQVPARIETRYLGFFRNGPDVVFHYRIGGAVIYDRLLVDDSAVRRALSIDGELPDDVRPSQQLATTIDDGQTKRIAHGATPRWSEQIVTTESQLGDKAHAFAIDTLAVPCGPANPFRTPMRIGGFDFLPDGRIAVATLVGDVWLVEGVTASLERLRWRRIAAGLNQPLGLVVQHGKIMVIGRDQLTRLHDLNGDDEADYYECVTHAFPTAGGDGFATSLNQDAAGSLYWFTYSNDFGVTRFDPASTSGPMSLATGLRGTNGIAVSPDGRIVLASVQEGTWTPATAIFEVRPGSYHGLLGPRPGHGPYGYDLPLCFIPRGIDNSSGEMIILPDDPRLGPLSGHIVGSSFGYCQHYLILREPIANGVQGGVVPLPGEFLSGAHRLRFSPRDGCLYVAGTDGWQSYARAPGSLQRLRYTGQPLLLPRRVETRANGLVLHFDQAIDPGSVRLERVFCEQWNYLYSAAYGSPEYSVIQPGRRGHDRVDVKSIRLLPDGRSVFVEIPTLHPVMQLHLYAELAMVEGQPAPLDLYYSVYRLGDSFTPFPGDQVSMNRPTHDPPFPTATNFPRDARLARQEDLGKDFSTLQGVVSLRVDAAGGLRFEPQVLRAPPGRRVALVVRNSDTGMPHNWVLVHPQRLDAIGEQSMRLAADPQAYATHYVPHDDGVLALSPILNPRDQYTVYFDSPRVRGAYPFICTFPGHWQVMRGVLFVLDDEQSMPEDVPFVAERTFVRDWQLAELAADADALGSRSAHAGHVAFHVAGCAQCHAVAGQGATWGPDLTKIRERYQGSRLLQQILEPSSEIHPAFQTVVVERRDGTVVSGMVVAETEQQLTILPNPLWPEEVTRIEQSAISSRSVAPVSTMPTGLLMTLTRDEILDLLAYLIVGGEHGPSPGLPSPSPSPRSGEGK